MVLLAVVDANYQVLSADVGTNGRISDGGVIRNTVFYDLLNKGKLNIPAPAPLPGSEKTVPFVFVGDEAFQLMNNFMKPYSQSVLNDERRIYNYRHSRARRVVENFFGILTSRFTIFQKPINISPEKVNLVVLTCCYLHNFLKKNSSNYVNQINTVDSASESNNTSVHPLMRCYAGSSQSAKDTRDTISSYFNNEGKVEWQANLV